MKILKLPFDKRLFLEPELSLIQLLWTRLNCTLRKDPKDRNIKRCKMQKDRRADIMWGKKEDGN